MASSDFITLSCPTCGGSLAIVAGSERFRCGHCGNEHLVRQNGGVLTIAPLVQEVRHVRTGVDKTAAELAIPRLQSEIVSFEKQRQLLAQTKNGKLVKSGIIETLSIPAVVLLLLVWVGLDNALTSPQPVIHSIITGIALTSIVVLLGVKVWYYSSRMLSANEMRNKLETFYNDEILRRKQQISRNIELANS